MEGDVPPDALFYENGNASTTTSDGIVTRWDNTELEMNDEWFSYVQITESIIRPCKKSAKSYDDDGAGDEKRVKIPMRKSLFPFVPPYVLFHSINCNCRKLPVNIGKHLKWKLSGVTPKIVARTVRKSGYRLVTDSEDWSGVWSQSFNDATAFKQANSFQKLNCFPGSQNLGCKNLLWTNIKRMRKRFGLEEFSFVPETFVLPVDIARLRESWGKKLDDRWIVKPPSSGRGQGIRVIDRWWEVPKWHSVVVQRYLTKPKLINGSKFDLRVYVLATSIDPLRVYVYSEGLVRFASVKYIDNPVNLNDRFMHLTNTSVNKYSPTYIANDSVDSSRGHKWSFKTLWAHLARDGVDVKRLWSRIKDIVIKTLISGESSMRAAVRENLSLTYSCYELYGFDILLDEDCKPWLLEVNTLPSLHTDSILDSAIKGPLIRNVLNIAGYQLPGTMTVFQERQLAKEYSCAKMRQDERMYSKNLSSEEIRKQSEFLKIPERANYILAILKDLTRDDVRQLIRYEDELTQLEKLEKIFPTPKTHKYHRFFESPRYYNLLFDAWEFQACRNKSGGIQRLKILCEKKFHL